MRFSFVAGICSGISIGLCYNEFDVICEDACHPCQAFRGLSAIEWWKSQSRAVVNVPRFLARLSPRPRNWGIVRLSSSLHRDVRMSSRLRAPTVPCSYIISNQVGVGDTYQRAVFASAVIAGRLDPVEIGPHAMGRRAPRSQKSDVIGRYLLSPESKSNHALERGKVNVSRSGEHHECRWMASRDLELSERGESNRPPSRR